MSEQLTSENATKPPSLDDTLLAAWNWLFDVLRVNRPQRTPHPDSPQPDSTAVLKEFEILHKQIEKTVDEVATTERWTIIGIAAVWAFLLRPDKGTDVAHLTAHVPGWAWGIPFFLAVAGALKVLSLYYDYGVMSEYIFAKLEPKAELRWESYTLARGNHLWGRGIYPYLLWGGLFLVTLIGWITAVSTQ